MDQQIVFASDHAGFHLKQAIIYWLRRESTIYTIHDIGVHSPQSIDYPDIAAQLAQYLKDHPDSKAVAICGSGNGICLALNRFPHIRAILGWSEQAVIMGRKHNDANVLCLSGWWTPIMDAVNFVKIFIQTPFEGGRHSRRVQKLSSIKFP